MVKQEFEQMQTGFAHIVGQYCSVKDDSIWAGANNRLPVVAQGIKIHIAATIFSAAGILQKCQPVIHEYGVHYKVAKSLIELKKLNSGLHYGISQMGKFITVYCDNEAIAGELMEALHQATIGENYIQIPYDLQYKKNSCVFYRYGAFTGNGKLKRRGVEMDAIINPKTNKPEPDHRGFGKAIPRWYKNQLPFYKEQEEVFKNYIIYRSLSQRGKGGVYDAVKWNEPVLREVIIKEGRKNGEIDIDRTDGYKRVYEEYEVMKSGVLSDINHPQLIESFTLNGHFYLVLEKIKGSTLQTWAIKNKKTLSLNDLVEAMTQMAKIVLRMHQQNRVWRDIKPSNLMRDESGQTRPIDMEGVVPEGKMVFLFGSEGFIAPEANATFYKAARENDVYSVGASMFFLITKTFLKADRSNLDLLLRKRIPMALKNVIVNCLSVDPAGRPDMGDVVLLLENICTSGSPAVN